MKRKYSLKLIFGSNLMAAGCNKRIRPNLANEPFIYHLNRYECGPLS